MTRSAILGIIAAFAAFVAFVVLSAHSESSVSCEVCVRFQGLKNCATAAATTEAEAARSAQSTACALIAGGVTDGIACGNTPPASKSCGPAR